MHRHFSRLVITMTWVVLSIAALAGCSDSSSKVAVATSREAIVLPSGFVEEDVAGPWNAAVGLTFSSDGRLFVWEKAGRVWEVHEDGTRHDEPFIDIRDEVGNWRDHGMLGFALHPNFPSNGYIYLFYVVDYHHLKHFGTPSYSPTVDEYFIDTIARVTRYRARASDGFESVDPQSRTVLIGNDFDDGCPMMHESHGVGTVLFGDDGSLLVSCGDGASYNRADNGGPTERPLTGLADHIIAPAENVGAFRAQLVDSLSGKVLRVDAATGDGLPGNPYFDSARPRAPRSRVWALGLRNPFRMTLRPETGHHDPAAADPGTLYIGDVGWETWEELDVARGPAANFGWPLFEGHVSQPRYAGVSPANANANNPLFGTTPAGQPPCTQASFKFTDLIRQDSANPVTFPNPCDPSQSVPSTVPTFKHTRPTYAYGHGSNDTQVPTFDASGAATTKQVGSAGGPSGNPFAGLSATGGVWYTAADFPSTYKDTYFQADYASGWIQNYVFDDQDHLLAVRPFAPLNQAPIVMMTTNPLTGGLYYVSYGNAVRRIRYAGGGNRPPVASISATPQFGPSPLGVTLSATGSRDPELGPLTYSWDFGDGTTSTLADVTHVFGTASSVAATYPVKLTVRDVQGATATTTLPVVVNDTPPRVTISEPRPGGVFSISAPSTVTLQAVPEDDEQSSAPACNWQTILHHNQHSHAEEAQPGCLQSAQVSPVTCEGESYSFEFKVTVTDDQGLTATKSTLLYPDCTPAPLAPTGPTSAATFTWRAVAGADSYDLVVNDGNGSAAVSVQLAPSDVGCPSGTGECSFSIAGGLAVGPGSFRLRAHNPVDGWRAWSNTASFVYVQPTCSDGVQNQGETGVDCGGPCATCVVTCGQQLLNVAGVTPSSQEPGYPAANAVDGSSATRWSSAYGSDPQWLRLELSATRRVTKVILRWEAAASADYELQVSDGASGPWVSIFRDNEGSGGTKVVTGLNSNARYVRVLSHARVLQQWGISLFELEVYGDLSTSCGGTCGNASVDSGEQCDDGNSNDADDCRNDCRLATCADGVRNHGESGVDCGGPCPACFVCGDGVVTAGEACDDGNGIDDDTCNNACQAATCTDTVKNQGETGTDCGGPCPACSTGCADGPLTIASATASSQDSGFPVSRAVDGSLTTRWSSAYGVADPQWIQVDLAAPRRVKRVVLRWEAAASTNYDIQVSNGSSGPWSTTFHDSNGAGGTKTIGDLNATARYVRLLSNARMLPEWGISLFELEVYGDSNATCGTCGNGQPNPGEECDDGNTVDTDDCRNDCHLATCTDGVKNHGETAVDCGGPCAACVSCGDGVVGPGEACDDGNNVDDDTCSNACRVATCTDATRNQGEAGIDCGGPCSPCGLSCAEGLLGISGATASSQDAAFPVGRAVDGSLATRWSSAYGVADPQWLQVDLGALRRVKKVVLRWESASSTNYDLQASTNAAGPWTTVFHDSNGTGGTKTIADLNTNARYVRLLSNARLLQQWGVSLFELEVYGDNSTTCGTCGNGQPNASEECDDGNTVDDDGCRNDCHLATCSDGLKNHGEAGVDCGGPCGQCVVCGDGVVAGSEACDDGNTVNDDACSNTCRLATCTDGLTNHGETGVDCGGPCNSCALSCAENELEVTGVTASSQQSGFPASAATDGSTTSRWSSAYGAADPQWIRVDLGAPRRIKKVTIRWEAAASIDYDLQVASSSSGPWTSVFHDGTGAGGVKTISDLNANARYVRLLSNVRMLQQWGISLFELDVYGDPSTTCGTCGNGAPDEGEGCDDGNPVDDDACSNSCQAATCSDGIRNQGETAVDCGGPCAACVAVCADGALSRVAAAASSVEGASYSAAAAIDGSSSTRWSSLYADPQWLRVDLGEVRRVKRVVLRWEVAASAVYDLEVSDSSSGPWVSVHHDAQGSGGVKTISGLNVNTRFVRLHSTARIAPQWGISLYELEVYGDPSPTCGP